MYVLACVLLLVSAYSRECVTCVCVVAWGPVTVDTRVCLLVTVDTRVCLLVWGLVVCITLVCLLLRVLVA